MQCRGTVATRFSIITPPPILYFESIDLFTATPLQVIDLPLADGTAQYKLVSVIYLGNFHFSARFTAEGNVWNYDGRDHKGTPKIEPAVADCELFSLAQFNGRVPHVYIYIFDNLNPSHTGS